MSEATQLLIPIEAVDGEAIPPEKPTHLGPAKINYGQAKTILTSTNGFIDAFDFTLNPYSGCTFGCTYCYAAFFAREQAQQDNWGYWVKVKENAVSLLKKMRAKPLTGRTIYMSSVTDPYQPIERQLKLSRQILEELVTYHQPNLVIQTRGPLVVRDIDLLQQFKQVRVNMSVTTDDDEVRRVFEPSCSSIGARLKAISQVHNAGIQTCITISPMLPVKNAETFANRLLTTGVPRFVVRPFHNGHGRFVAGTREGAMRLLKEHQWDEAAHERTAAVLRLKLPNLSEGKDGFNPK